MRQSLFPLRTDLRRGSLQTAISLPLAFLVFLVLAGCGQPAPATAPERAMDITTLLGDENAPGYARAETACEFIFPRDHGPHPDFRSEWWYFTGNLWDEDLRRYGFQLTFFRFALSPQAPERDSAWATNQAYMAHFAITDAGGKTFHGSERLSRGALDLAGAQADPFRVWLGGWEEASANADLADAFPSGESFPWKLEAAEDNFGLSLVAEPLKEIVLQGDRGLSRKGPQPGNASYYYSITRIAVRGTLTLNVESRAVSGTAWFDHEWSTSALGEDLVGWDWFALQLQDDTDLMYYRLRRTDGSADPLSEGTLVRPTGESVRLEGEDVAVQPLDKWRSPASRAEYPTKWKMRIEPLGVDLIVRAVIDGQEQSLSVRYWEGAVDVLDESEIGPLGWGYMELTGYARP